MTEGFVEYAKQVLKNAKAMCDELIKRGYTMVSGKRLTNKNINLLARGKVFLLSNNFRAKIKINFRFQKIDRKNFKIYLGKIINQIILF